MKNVQILVGIDRGCLLRPSTRPVVPCQLMKPNQPSQYRMYPTALSLRLTALPARRSYRPALPGLTGPLRPFQLMEPDKTNYLLPVIPIGTEN